MTYVVDLHFNPLIPASRLDNYDKQYYLLPLSYYIAMLNFI